MKKLMGLLFACALVGAVGFAGSSDYEAEACYTLHGKVVSVEECKENKKHEVLTVKCDNGDWVMCNKKGRFSQNDKVILIIDECGTTYDLSDDVPYAIRKEK